MAEEEKVARSVNGLALSEWWANEGEGTCELTLSCTMAEALALDGNTLTVTEDGDVVATFPHHHIESVRATGDGTVSVTARRTVDETTATLVDSLTARFDAIDSALAGIRKVTDALKSSKLLGLTIGGDEE